MVVNVAGEELIARPDKSLYWPARQTLFLADLHLGKGAAFRAGSIPIPPGSTAATLEAVTRAIQDSGANRLVVLGDLWHSKSGRDEGTRGRFAEWRKDHPDLQMLLVVGNHDAKSGPLESEGFEVLVDPLNEGPFLLTHEPCEPETGCYALSGHIHPSVTLEGKGRQAIRLPCFWFAECCGVLPSFGWFTGTADVRPEKRDTVLVIAEGRVFRVQ